jgi:NAD(P)-dependent dehydrogenase (short-subunit alcohol dehydrogenase family)
MINPLQMSGKTILVTGSSSGIGRSTAILLSQLGARVVLVGRNTDRLKATLDVMEGDGHHVAPFDLEQVDAIGAFVDSLVQSTGRMHGLVCCAGVSSLRPLRATSAAQFEKEMRINCTSAVSLTSAFCKKSVRQPEASVVLVASVAGLRGSAARTAYSASKGALIAFMRSAAVELAPAGVRVNCVAPAYVKTEMYDAAEQALSAETLDAMVRSTQPLGVGMPIDVAYSIAFLLAVSGRWITGSVLSVDGGCMAK